MKIKTDRAWNLETVQLGDCLDIREHHQGSEEESTPYVVIPFEAVDHLITQLEKFKKMFD